MLASRCHLAISIVAQPAQAKQKKNFAKPLPYTPDYLLKHAGYHHFIDPNTGKESYIRRLSSQFYPRFHVYVMETDKVITFDLHIDQKKPSYKGTAAHGGEYDGPVVEEEIARLRAAFQRTVLGAQ